DQPHQIPQTEQPVHVEPPPESDAGATDVSRPADDGPHSAPDLTSHDGDPGQVPPEKPDSPTVSRDSSSRPDENDPDQHIPDADADASKQHGHGEDSSVEHEELKHAASLPHADTDIDHIRSWLGAVNFDVHDTHIEDRMLNCGQTTIAVFDRLSGRDGFQT